MRASPALIALLLLLVTSPSQAQNSLIGFHAPSKNIACQFYEYDGPATPRCDIMEIATEVPRPKDCEEDWGHAFEMTVKGPAGRVCAGDTVNDPSLPPLAYGEVWQHGGFTCRSEEAGITCFNAMQHGFSLSRAAQKLF